MASLIESEAVDSSTPDVDLDSKCYQRLSTVDKTYAETLKSFWKANAASEATATRLANRAAVQDFSTSIPLAMADVLAVGGALVVALLSTNFVLGQVHQQRLDVSSSLFLSLLVLPIAHLASLYPGLGLGSIVEFKQLTRALFATFCVFAGIAWFQFPEARIPHLASVALAFIVAIPSAMILRFFARALCARCRWWGAPVLIVADLPRGMDLAKRMHHESSQGLRPVGLLLNPDQYWTFEKLGAEAGIPCYDIRRTSEVAERLGATWVVVSPCANRETTPALDSALASIPNRILLSSNQLDMGIWDELFCLGSHTGLRLGGAHSSKFKLAFKRLIDVIFTSSVLLAGLPVLIVICLMVRLSSRGPIFYSQKRVGLGGKEFKAWKFRSMVQDADKVLEKYLDENPSARREWDETHKLAKDPRVTTIGKFLRATSFDELPQLWNILIGEMSLVGPRPIIDSPTYDAAYIREYCDEFEAYKTVRPGLTGLWQVRCRSNGVYELRIYWDMYYIRNWCIWLDLYLIMRTVKTVLFREGAS